MSVSGRQTSVHLRKEVMKKGLILRKSCKLSRFGRVAPVVQDVLFCFRDFPEIESFGVKREKMVDKCSEIFLEWS